MKYNEKYGRWFTNGGLVYRYSKVQDKLVLCKQSTKNGYKFCRDSSGKLFSVHRAVYETFVGEIPDGYEIDHIYTIRDDNRVEKLQAVTHKENTNNPITRQHYSEAKKGIKLTNEHKKKISDYQRNRPKNNSEFGQKYVKHFGYSRSENIKQYKTEFMWYKRKGRCRWE